MSIKDRIDNYISMASKRPLDDSPYVSINVSPEDARVLLAYSAGNRRERERAIAAYARDMASGNWMETNLNPLAFTRDGRLRDGHHRLLAIIRAGVTVRMLVSFGNPEGASSVVDAGVTRTLADRMSLSGMPSSHRELAALRVCMHLASGSFTFGKAPTLAEVQEASEQHGPALAAFAPHLSVKRLPSAALGALMFAFPSVGERAVRFAEEVSDGEGATGTVYLLREYLRRNAKRTRELQAEDAARTLYALKAYVQGRSISKFAPKNEPKILEFFSGGK
jgi:hypothetical protein